jgi:hypothetical protein
MLSRLKTFVIEMQQQGGESALVVVLGRLLPHLIRDGVGTVGEPRNTLRECQSGSLPVREYGKSRQAATSNNRSNDSPDCWPCRRPESMHELDPLIWLARR